MTRSQLLDSVWSYDSITESNVVDIYIHYLRNKIDKGFDKKLIRTVRGMGYAIRAEGRERALRTRPRGSV